MYLVSKSSFCTMFCAVPEDCKVFVILCACVCVLHEHPSPNWSMLAEAPAKDPSPLQARGPNAAASPTQMDLTAGRRPRGPRCPSPTDGVSQRARRFTSIPIKAWPASAVTFYM